MKLPLTIGAKVASAIYDADGVPVCVIDSMQEASREQEREMARRIVACVNICSGASTEIIEKGARHDWADLMTELEAQRDELLAALEEVTTELDDTAWSTHVGPMLDRAKAAIAKAKGGAA